MPKLEDAVERIKKLECPTGDMENRVAGILEDYGVANKNEITIKRDENLDRDGAEGYSVRPTMSKERSIVVLATSGMDDYVAKVVDAYIE